MHDILPPLGADAQCIQGYRADGYRIGNAEYPHAVLVLPRKTWHWNGEYTAESLTPLFEEKPPVELLLIGMQGSPVPQAFLTQLRTHGIGMEIMGIGAACRTFNVLIQEGRRVAALLTKSEKLS